MVPHHEFDASNMESGQNISDYIFNVEFIVRKLKTVSASFYDKTIISKIFTGLTEKYRHFVT